MASRARRVWRAAAYSAYLLTVSLVGTEAIFRLTPYDRLSQHGIYRECRGCGYVYQHRPGADGISAQGLRDREFRIPKPAGTLRILVLGDSVTFGEQVHVEDTFPKRLEALLAADGRTADVINAGVNGYSPFNERAYYKERGRLFEPDVVIIAFCMNDIADPLAHWDFTGRNLLTIPADAIPNPRYHADDILPRYRVSHAREVASRYSHGFLALSLRFAPLAPPPRGTALPRAADEDGRLWPTYVTLEQPKSLEPLLDHRSAEWQWLRRIYDDLAAAIADDGATPLFVFFPLDYQLNPGYPFLPQSTLMQYCADRSFQCLDLLPRFRADANRRPFLRYRAGFLDVWHLSVEGHALAAQEIAALLRAHGLLHGP